MTLQTQIIQYLEDNPSWQHKGEIIKGLPERKAGYGNLERRMRELAEAGKIEKRTCDCVKPRHIVYKIKPEERKDWWNEPEYQRKLVKEEPKLF